MYKTEVFAAVQDRQLKLVLARKRFDGFYAQVLMLSSVISESPLLSILPQGYSSRLF